MRCCRSSIAFRATLFQKRLFSHEPAGIRVAPSDSHFRRLAYHLAWAGKRPAICADPQSAFAALHRDIVEQHAACLRDGCGRHLAGFRNAIELHQGPPGRRNLSGLPQHRRQRIVQSPRPSLSAIPQGQVGRLEGRLGPRSTLSKNGSPVGQDIKLIASDNFQLGGYRADPATAPKAAVVVIQEIFGVNHHIRAVCDRLAGEGYVAIAPSIFDRIEPNFQCGYSPDEVAVARKFVANPDWAAMLRDTQAAIDAVRDVGPVGIIGFCLGGSVAYAAATKLSGLSAAIGYYGGRLLPL